MHGDIIRQVVEELCSTGPLGTQYAREAERNTPLPSRDVVIQLVKELRRVLFPGYFGHAEMTAETRAYHLGATLDYVSRTLETQIQRGLLFQNPENKSDFRAEAAEITRSFLLRLPQVRRILLTDVQAHYEGDPAAQSPEETIFSYPGLLAIMQYRLAHELLKLNVPLLPRMITEYAHNLTGIDIHPGAQIDEHFFIDHGTGVVVGETCIIGRGVRIYQGVTLGAKSFPLDADGNPIKGIPRHPIVEDGVIIYSGATILGRITIGRESVIGGNVWLTHDVPPHSRVSQSQASLNRFTGGEDSREV
jgi:serine O-acetyltransferase